MKKIISMFMIFGLFFNIGLLNAHALTDGGGSVGLLVKETVADPIMTTITQRILKKVSDETVNWALGGFQGDPSFIGNWDQFLKDTKHELLSASLKTATDAASGLLDGAHHNYLNQETIDALYTECILEAEIILEQEPDEYINEEDINNEYNEAIAECEEKKLNSENYGQGGFSSQTAQSNYEKWKNGEITKSRKIVSTVTSVAQQNLYGDNIAEQLIKGEGETLSKLLGGNEQAQDCKTDIESCGILGFIALSDRHNTDFRRSHLIQDALNTQVEESVEKKVDDIQSPQKFLNKESCTEYEKDEDGSIKKDSSGNKICAKSEVQTPGSQIASRLNKSLDKKDDQLRIAREVSDVLARALGQLVDGLIQQGLTAALQGVSGNTNTEENNLINSITGNYQNSYDVLGISNQGNQNETEETIKTAQETYSNHYSNSEYGADGSSPYVGGPEHLSQNGWGQNPELIVNLQEVIEPSIEKNIKYLELLQNTRNIMRSNISNIIELDRCIPGPDYNWQERYSDFVNRLDPSSKRALLSKPGLEEMKIMISDPKVNIPGAQIANSLIHQSFKNTQEYSTTAERITSTNNTLGILNSLKSDIKKLYREDSRKISDITLYTGTSTEGIDINLKELILFNEDWEKLSQSKKNELASLKIIESYYSFRDNGTEDTSDDETVEQALANNEEKIRNAVISMFWDVWRSATHTEELKKEKSIIRHVYNSATEGKSATNNDILLAEQNLKQNQESVGEVKDILDDCVQIKSFVTGISPEGLKNLHKDKKPANRFLYHKKLYTDEGESVFGLKTAGKSNEDLKSFIENNQSLKTDVFNSEGIITNSILGFENQTELEQYFENNYPNENIVRTNLNNNALNVSKMYEIDSVYTEYDRAKSMTGTLYCRMRSQSDLDSSGSNNDDTDCLGNFYKLHNLEYQALLSDI